MKTVAKFYEVTKENRLPNVLEYVCKVTTYEEHTRIKNDYFDNRMYCKSLSFCWWLEDSEADCIAKNWNI